MKLTTVKEIYREREKYLDKEVTVGGWVRSVRDSKTFGFIVPVSYTHLTLPTTPYV